MRICISIFLSVIMISEGLFGASLLLRTSILLGAQRVPIRVSGVPDGKDTLNIKSMPQKNTRRGIEQALYAKNIPDAPVLASEVKHTYHITPPQCPPVLPIVPLKPPIQRWETPTLQEIPPPPDLPSQKSKRDFKVIPPLHVYPPPPVYEQASDTCYNPLEDFKKLYSEFIAIDTEATGLGHGHKITEIAGVVMRNFQPTGEFFHTLLNPNRNVTPSAEKITGYTFESLKSFPVFGDISQRFFKFIGGRPLLFHNAHFDCKLLNEGARNKNPHHPDLQRTNAIIDSQIMANEMFPQEGNSLKKLADKYKIDSLLQGQMHGALSDAMQLIGVMRNLIKMNNSKFYTKHPIKWDLVKEININDEFESVKYTAGEQFFRAMGIICDIPEAFKYVHNMYHPGIGDNAPAIVSALTSFDGEIRGYYVRFFSLQERVSSPANFAKKKYVFGTEDNGMISISEGSMRTVFIGLVPAALHIHTLLNHKRIIPPSIRHFLLDQPASIKAITHLSYLPAIQFPKLTQVVFILLNTVGSKLKDEDRQVLAATIERYAHPQFFSLMAQAAKIENLLGYILKYKQIDWKVSTDTMVGNIRHLTLKKIHEPDVLLAIDTDRETICENGRSIDNPNTSVLLARAPIQLKVIRIGKQDICQTTSLDSYYKALSTRISQHESVKRLGDIPFIETCEEARSDFQNALTITEECAVRKYFNLRGITTQLPEEFKYMPAVFHPGIEKKLPATLIPLTNAEGIMVGVHRIFCGENGERLAKQNKLPPKLSLGRTVRAAFEIYKYNNDPKICFISEGFENALVARDAIKHLLNIKEKRQSLFEKFNIDSSFAIKACVGINGLIDIPFSKKTQTIVILADNDGFNQDVKRTMKQTVDGFIKRDFVVYIAMPPALEHNKKPDLNDIYFVNGKEDPNAVFETLMNAVQIKDSSELGGDDIATETAIIKLQIAQIHTITKNGLDSLMHSILNMTHRKNGAVAKR